ncbi:MAG: 1-acyl-sn-glycerol-3-phosphate acyltransferase [Saprospiraceae bacterium]|jgi:1-acyl-sn-glycerol-3-phosphate acyltransferase
MLYYRLIRPFARLTLRTFYKKIYITGLENYPKDKPVILALNHPTAFIEPCILATILPQELHFLVRGDFFRQPLHNHLLHGMGCLPVFRMKDGGYENIKNNYSTFDAAYKALNKGEPIIILAEGTSLHEKRLRPLKKGTARLAFGTMTKFGVETDVHIVPVGVNYTYSDKFRSEVMIEFNKPIKAADYWKTYQENNAQGIKEMTAELRKRMEEKIVIIEEKEDEDFVDKQFVLSRNGKPQPIMPILSKTGYRFKAEKRISDTINELSNTEKLEQKTATNSYFENLRKLDISDLGLLSTGNYGIGSVFALVLGFIPFLFGYIFNAPPLLLANYIGTEKTSYIEFKAPVTVAVGLFAYPLWWVLLLIITGFIGNPSIFIMVLLLPLLGSFALLYREFYGKFKEGKKAGKVDANVREKLLEERHSILI